MKRQWLGWALNILLLLVILTVSVLLSLSIGEISIPIEQIGEALSDSEGVEYGVLSYIRIPRIVLGIAIGGSLSLAGAILQGVYRNPLVEPYTLGISGGASLGVTLVIVLGLHLVNVLLMPIAGFVGAFITIFLVATLGLSKGKVSVNRMLLIGVMLSFISSSGVMFLMSITKVENIHSIIFWTMGSLNESNPTLVWGMLVLALVCLLFVYLFVTPLNALRLGEEKASHLGINSSATIRILFLITSLLTGACIAVGGVIGFVGLVMPHIIRLWVGSDYRILLLASFFSGSIFLVLSDLLARTVIAPNELPIGVITGIVGGITFIVLLARSSKKSRLLQ